VKILDFNERLKESSLSPMRDGLDATRCRGTQRCFDEVNSTEPEAVFRVHQAYIEAGAQIIETNTFGANRFKLEPLGLGEEVQRLNSRGVKIAREAANPPLAKSSSPAPSARWASACNRAIHSRKRSWTFFTSKLSRSKSAA